MVCLLKILLCATNIITASSDTSSDNKMDIIAEMAEMGISKALYIKKSLEHKCISEYVSQSMKMRDGKKIIDEKMDLIQIDLKLDSEYFKISLEKRVIKLAKEIESLVEYHKTKDIFIDNKLLKSLSIDDKNSKRNLESLLSDLTLMIA
ncbi:hypothetical protein H311_00254 [Anncaliia algerae PRA109]|nr:hypothetical protein H311_00254 [Anncaliia algerae PRA109]